MVLELEIDALCNSLPDGRGGKRRRAGWARCLTPPVRRVAVDETREVEHPNRGGTDRRLCAG